jgi:hypothetical protein
MPRINYVSTDGPGGPVQQGVTQEGAQASDYGYLEIGSDGLNPPGSFPFRVDQYGTVSVNGASKLLQLQAATPAAGYALADGTGTVVSWTAPGDGQVHRVIIIANVHVTGAETGGQLGTVSTAPDGSVRTNATAISSGGQATGTQQFALLGHIIEAGSTVEVLQNSALTAGAATAWVEIWGA